jgi:hypothetical protein
VVREVLGPLPADVFHLSRQGTSKRGKVLRHREIDGRLPVRGQFQIRHRTDDGDPAPVRCLKGQPNLFQQGEGNGVTVQGQKRTDN